MRYYLSEKLAGYLSFFATVLMRLQESSLGLERYEITGKFIMWSANWTVFLVYIHVLRRIFYAKSRCTGKCVKRE